MGTELTDRIVPVILAGGLGSRLWPLSTASTPKQFLHLTGSESLLRQTLRRCAGLSAFAVPLIVAGESQESSILADLAGIGMGSTFLLKGPAEYVKLFPDSDLAFWKNCAQFPRLLLVSLFDVKPAPVETSIFSGLTIDAPLKLI